MTPEAQRIAIAEWCGWKPQKCVSPIDGKTELTLWYSQGPRVVTSASIPDYLGDLNAMHEAEEKLTGDDRRTFIFRLYDVLGGAGSRPTWSADIFNYAHATAAQRCEALLRTIGKWREE